MKTKFKFKLKRKIEKSDITCIITLLLLAALFIYLGVQYAKLFGDIRDADIKTAAKNLQELILSYGTAGIFVFTLLHVIQVVVSFIPAAIVQFAGGMIYGLWEGVLIAEIGIAAGTIISFLISRYLGKRVVTLFVSEKTVKRFEGVTSSGMTDFVILAMYLFPGFPKDFIAYFMGLTNMKAWKLIVISAVGRLPGMLVSTYLGTRIYEGNYVLIAIISILCGLVIIPVYFYRDKLMALIAKKR